MTDTNKKVGTHGFIQQVQRHKGLPQSIKTVLVHCLTKYQARDGLGNYYTFSISRIEDDTGLGHASVHRAIVELKRHKVLREIGSRRFNINQYKPTILHSFSLDALKSYLEVKSKVEMSITPNKDNDETTIEASQKHGVKSKVKSKVKSTMDCHKKIVEEDSTKKEEGISTGFSDSTNLNPLDTNFNSVSQSSTPAASLPKVSMAGLNECEAQFNAESVKPLDVSIPTDVWESFPKVDYFNTVSVCKFIKAQWRNASGMNELCFDLRMQKLHEGLAPLLRSDMANFDYIKSLAREVESSTPVYVRNEV